MDFDELAKVGSIMGSGGMIVMDEDTCMVEVARYFLAFSQQYQEQLQVAPSGKRYSPV